MTTSTTPPAPSVSTDASGPAQSGSQSHTISVFVANKPGVLARIAQVFARRAFNIDSLVVSPAAKGGCSRMTITAKGSREGLYQIIKHVNKLVDVIHCFDHTFENTVVKELALLKIGVGPDLRGDVLQIVEHFGAKTADLTETSMIIMATGNSDKLDAMIEMLRKFNLIEIVRTGKVVMARGGQET